MFELHQCCTAWHLCSRPLTRNFRYYYDPEEQAQVYQRPAQAISTDIIEQGPPEQLVATFHKLFDGEIKETKSVAVQAAQRYGLLPGLIE